MNRLTRTAQPDDPLIARSAGSEAEWRALLAQLPNAHALQSWAWGGIKSRWGWQPLHLVWQSAGQPRAAALVLRRSIPYTPFAMLYVPKGPVLDYADAPLRRTVIERLQQIARSERGLFIKIDPDVLLATDVEPQPVALGQQFVGELLAAGWRFSPEQVQFRNTVTFDLTQSEDDLLRAMKQKTRYNIRVAGRNDVSVRLGTAADFPAIHALYAETSERNEFTIRPPAYYDDVWRTFHAAGMLRPLLAEYDGQLLAAALIVYGGSTAIYMYGASSNAERHRMPTYLLQWEALRQAKADGMRSYDMWGAPDLFEESDRLWGVWRFKAGFNGTVARHIGAWDYPIYPRLYRLFTDWLPRYRNLLRRRQNDPKAEARTYG